MKKCYNQGSIRSVVQLILVLLFFRVTNLFPILRHQDMSLSRQVSMENRWMDIETFITGNANQATPRQPSFFDGGTSEFDSPLRPIFNNATLGVIVPEIPENLTSVSGKKFGFKKTQKISLSKLKVTFFFNIVRGWSSKVVLKYKSRTEFSDPFVHLCVC